MASFINTFFLTWVLGSIWYLDESLSLKDIYQEVITLGLTYEKIYFFTFICMLMIFLTNFLLHFFLAIKTKIPLKQYFGHLVVSLAVYFFTALPITLSLLGGFFGKKITFEPSNSKAQPISFLELVKQMNILWGLSVIALFQYFLNNQTPWNYLGGMWALIIFITPTILFFVHKRQVTGGKNGHQKKEINTKITLPPT